MKATAPYLYLVLADLMNSLVSERPILKEKNPPVVRADKAKGDGGVDVTGAPKSGPVEGAGFGRLLSFPALKRSFTDRIILELRAYNCYHWGLQFLSSR